MSKVFKKCDVKGFDIVELCPNASSKPSEFLAAKLYYKMLAYKFKNEAFDEPYESTFGTTHTVKKFKPHQDEA